MVEWTDNLEQGLDIDEVKKIQPDYLEIDWASPLVLEDEKWYLITKIDWNWDPLSMSNYLVFSNDGYLYRESKK